MWKFNPSLLTDPGSDGYIKGEIEMEASDCSNINDDSLKWELMKLHILNATVQYTKTQAALKREYEDPLNKKYQDFHAEY